MSDLEICSNCGKPRVVVSDVSPNPWEMCQCLDTKPNENMNVRVKSRITINNKGEL